MSAAQHTPGPWEWLGGKYELTALVQRHPEGGGSYVLSAEAEVGDYGLSVTTTLDVSEANARLIAAAPDLLAACETALDDIDVEQMPVTIRVLKAAIAKAKGEV